MKIQKAQILAKILQQFSKVSFRRTLIFTKWIHAYRKKRIKSISNQYTESIHIGSFGQILAEFTKSQIDNAGEAMFV